VAGLPPARLIHAAARWPWPAPLPDSTRVSPPHPRPVVLAVAVVVAVGAASCGGDDEGSSGSGAGDEGRQIVRRAGCTACHGADGEGGIGPAWASSLGTEIELDDGTTVTVDEEYLTTAIADPGAETHAGFSVTMPENHLTDAEIAAVVDYIVLLNGAPATEAGG
jgi:mono/diheme cytochrome c family protein